MYSTTINNMSGQVSSIVHRQEKSTVCLSKWGITQLT